MLPILQPSIYFDQLWRLVVFSLVALIAVHFTYCQLSSRAKKINRFPGPSFIPILGSTLLPWNVADTLNDRKSKFPKGTFRLWVGYRPFIFTTDCDHIQKIVTSQVCLDRADEVSLPLHKTLTENSILVASNKDGKWRSYRKMLTPGLNANMHTEFLKVFESHIVNLMAVFEQKCISGVEFDPLLDFAKWILGVSFETLLNWDSSMNMFDKDMAGFFKTYERATELAFYPALYPALYSDFMWRLSGYKAETRKLWHEMRKTFSTQFIQNKMTDWKAYAQNGALPKNLKYADILYTNWFDNDEVFLQIMTILGAAVDTTASALDVTLFLLAKHPEIQSLAYEEVKATIGIDPTIQMEPATINNLKYLEMVIKESMRMVPAAPALVRKVGEDLNLGNDLIIPKNTSVFINFRGLHYDPESFPEPTKFIPERWLPENVAKRHPFSFLPFGGGPRNCMGKAYAMLEMKFILAQLLYKYEVCTNMDGLDKIKFDHVPMPVARGGIMLYLKRR